MKVLGTIVNGKLNIVGLTLSGKASDFGKIGNQEEIQDITMQEVLARKFVNNQIDCSQGKIKELGKFRLRDVGMKMLLDNGQLTPVNNTLTLKTRLLNEGKLAGFEVEILGRTMKFKTDDVIRLSSWFRPENYMIAVRNDADGTVRPYVTGKPGHAIGKLPERELGVSKVAPKKTKNRTIQSTDSRGSGVANPDFDIVELFDIVSDLNGYVVKLPNVEYKKTKASDTKTGSGFIELGIGEVASAHIEYGEKSMNVNANFRKIGNVMVNFGGRPMPMPTYVVKRKSIFVNGKNHIKRFGIVVGEAQVNELRQKFGASLALEEVTDDSLVTPIRSMYGDPTLTMFIVDTNNLDVISKNRIKKYLLSDKEVYRLQLNLLEQKTILRYVNDLYTSSKSAMAESGIKDPRPKYGMYAGFSDEMISKIEEAGIDVFSGMYTKTELDTDEKSREASKVADMVKSGEYKKEEETDIGVEFGVKGLKSLPSVKDLKEQNKKAEKFITPRLLKIFNKVNELTSVSDMFKFADEIKKRVGKEKEETYKKLWLHKMACLSAGNYEAYKVVDTNAWEPMKQSKASNVTDYICKTPECSSLTLKLTNIKLK